MILYILKINNDFSNFLSFFADVSIYLTEFSRDGMWRQVPARDVIMLDFHKTKILNLYKFGLNAIIFLENMAINVPEHAKIWEISRYMRKSTYRHNFVKNDQIDLHFGQNHDFMEIYRFWEFYKNLNRWRHVPVPDVICRR